MVSYNYDTIKSDTKGYGEVAPLEPKVRTDVRLLARTLTVGLFGRRGDGSEVIGGNRWDT